jgi:hypothetical protein
MNWLHLPNKYSASAIVLITAILLSTVVLGATPGAATPLNIGMGNGSVLPPVYLVGSAASTSQIATNMISHGVNVVSTERPTRDEARNYPIIMFQSDWLRQNGHSFALDLGVLLARGGVVLAFGNDAGNALSTAAADFLTNRATVFAGQTFLNESVPIKVVTPQLPNDVTALALFTIGRATGRVPTTSFVYEVPSNPDSIFASAVDAWNQIQLNLPNWTNGLTLAAGKTPHSLTYNGFTYAGSIGWLSAQYNDWYGAKAGVHQVMIQYYYASQSSSAGNYYWFLNYVQHYTTGYCTTWSGCFTPDYTVEKINAHTNIWPGQILWQAGPTGLTCNPSCGTITYSLSVSNTGATAGVSYSMPAGITVNAAYNADGTNGIASWTHTFSGPVVHDTTFSMEPSVIYQIDPTKAGGLLPQVTSNHFEGSYCNWAACGNKAPDINFGTYVTTDPTQTKCTQVSNGACVQNTSGDATANVEIDACPTTDFYGRSAGLAVDKSLPVPWWPSYFYGYQFGTYGGCFTYNTSYSLPRGSNSLELGISGFCPSYCWSATIKVNGNTVAQGTVDRNNHLKASFNL